MKIKAKFAFGLLFVLLLASNMSIMASANSYSDEIEEGDEYTWTVETLKENGSSVEEPHEESSLPLVEGSEIVVSVDSDVSDVDTSDDDYQVHDYFSLKVDDTVVSLNPEDYEGFAYLEVAIYMGILLTANMNGSENMFDEVIEEEDYISKDGDEVVVDYSESGDSFSGDLGTVKYDYDSGLMNEWSQEGDETELLITRNSGLLGSLPVANVWVFFALIATPAIIAKLRKRNQ